MRLRPGNHDILFVTLDTLRYDVAARLLAAGRTPMLARALPGGVWERRHSPASFTYAAHHAFFAGFLPTPVTPGKHPRLYAAHFGGSETSTEDTWVFDAPDIVTALAAEGYHTVCLGGVGFFNPASALGRVLPGLFTESHWERGFGVTDPHCVEHQIERAEKIVASLPADKRLFLFVNVAAMHQPNKHYVPGLAEDSVESHSAALEYVDRHLGRLFALICRRAPAYVIITSDHGTAYGEGGHSGHRVAHEVVWTVPYGQFALSQGEWP